MTAQDPFDGRFDGIPGLMWYATSDKVRGSDLKAGDWLDSLDHRGARMIYEVADGSEGVRTVWFSGGGDDCETIRADVLYDVVDPDSQVAPDDTGSPAASIILFALDGTEYEITLSAAREQQLREVLEPYLGAARRRGAVRRRARRGHAVMPPGAAG